MSKQNGLLVLDDTTLDKPHAQKMELVTQYCVQIAERFYGSGKHRRVISGINLLTLLWTNGQVAFPCDCALYTGHLPEGCTKNHSLTALLQTARAASRCAWCASTQELASQVSELVQQFGQPQAGTSAGLALSDSAPSEPSSEPE